MNRLLLSPAARADLDEIWAYTSDRWSEEQAVRYTQLIRDVCAGVLDGTKPRRPVDIRPGYMKCAAGSHMVYFRERADDTIVVIRILHQRMDVSRHL